MKGFKGVIKFKRDFSISCDLDGTIWNEFKNEYLYPLKPDGKLSNKPKHYVLYYAPDSYPNGTGGRVRVTPQYLFYLLKENIIEIHTKGYATH
jgi:hypothetical protein